MEQLSTDCESAGSGWAACGGQWYRHADICWDGTLCSFSISLTLLQVQQQQQASSSISGCYPDCWGLHCLVTLALSLVGDGMKTAYWMFTCRFQCLQRIQCPFWTSAICCPGASVEHGRNFWGVSSSRGGQLPPSGYVIHVHSIRPRGPQPTI